MDTMKTRTLREPRRPRPALRVEPVLCLEAADPVEVPASLLRADGRSVYQRHGGTRYATRAQLAMEERMVTQAGAGGAPRVTRAQAAHALGADPVGPHVPGRPAPPERQLRPASGVDRAGPR